MATAIAFGLIAALLLPPFDNKWVQRGRSVRTVAKREYREFKEFGKSLTSLISLNSLALFCVSHTPERMWCVSLAHLLFAHPERSD